MARGPRVKRLWALSLLCSCVLVDASRNASEFRSLVTIRGEITQGFPTFLVLFRESNGGWERVSSRVLYAPAHFEILSEAGTLKLYAFTHASAAWKAGCGSALRALNELPEKAVIDLGHVELAENGPPPPEPIDFDAPDAPKDRVVMHRGDLATLDEERFRPEAGRLGLWQPVDFALKYGIGVSFLEPYDAKKTPVLFVHGASGTPQHFKALIAGLDRTRFQPWVFSYPSGTRLERTVTNLSAIVEDLRARYGFSRLLVVGYSMGGLVAHAFSAKSDVVKLLVTISAPYGGDPAARVGVQRSPVVVPFWLDMAEGSPFLRSLREPLRAPHVMFFSFKGRGDDGTVSLSSMLPPEIQDAAARVRGFDETHDSIVTSAAVVAAVNAALAEAR
jgi:pimeloyl-ACP methyl ester carboxylesterase